jgi:hypothetical protein
MFMDGVVDELGELGDLDRFRKNFGVNFLHWLRWLLMDFFHFGFLLGQFYFNSLWILCGWAGTSSLTLCNSSAACSYFSMGPASARLSSQQILLPIK